VVDWFGADWLGRLVEVGVAPPGRRGVCQVVVTGPSGETRFYVTVDGGRLTGAGEGSIERADVTFTVSEAEVGEPMAVGSLDPAVAFMQGRVKTAGDPGWVLETLAAWSSPAGRQAIASLATTS
jgi:hypothetical protein